MASKMNEDDDQDQICTVRTLYRILWNTPDKLSNPYVALYNYDKALKMNQKYKKRN